MRKVILCIFCTISVHLLAQKKIVLEQIRCYNSNLLVRDFLLDPAIERTIASQLNNTLQQKQHTTLTDTNKIRIELVDFYLAVQPVEPQFEPDTSVLHLYIDLLEVNPFYYFRDPKNKPADTSLQGRIKTIFSVSASLIGYNKKIILHNNLEVMIAVAETPGIGVPYGKGIGLHSLAVLPKTFTDFLKISFDYLFDTSSQVSQVEMKMRPAFFSDNYILPKTIAQPRIFVSTTKNISVYTRDNKKEMIRMDEPVYEQILLKDKKAPVYPAHIIQAIKKAENYRNSDFVFLRQDGRDIIRDKNYLLKLVAQVAPEFVPLNNDLVFTHFLPGELHYLLQENDTLASFSIRTKVPSGNRIYNIISNGIDSSVLYKGKFGGSSMPVEYNYIAEGRIGHQPFAIKCSGFPNAVKEIFLDDRLVCIAQGKFTPEKFVIFDASLSPGLLNQLFLIGFNRFFE